ncbi:hypothetical protein L7F22_043536 [Adiantum nelumboides]|nr:hypothetical protein [Adiantum nelumboides]
MYGGEVESWGDPFANNLFYNNNDQLDDEGRYIFAAAPPPPPGVSPSLLYSSPNKLQQMRNQQANNASDSPTKRGQSSTTNIQPSPLRMGNNAESQKENQPIRPEQGVRTNSDPVPTNSEPIVRLYDWYIGLQPTQQALSYYSEAKGIKKWIQIYGIRYRSEENDDPNSKGKRKADDKGEPWHSSLISERMSSNLVKSKSGKLYELMGKFDEVASCKRKKVSAHTAAQFRNGFPPEWADIVCEEARFSKGQKLKPKSPSKPRPGIETESFLQSTKAQSVSQRPKPRPTISGKQLPEPKAQPKARKKKSLFRDDEESSESEYHPSSDGESKKNRRKGKRRRSGNKDRDDDGDFISEDSEGDDSLYEEVTSKSKKNAKKEKSKQTKSMEIDLISEDEEMSSRSPSPDLEGRTSSSLHQMNNARSKNQGQERKSKQARKSEPMPRPRELSPPSSPAGEENAKKAKPIPRELRNLSKTGFGRLTLVQNAIMEQLEQNRSERKKQGRQSLPLMRTNAPQTPLSQIGNNSNLITPRSSRRTRTPVQPWWEVQPSTKSKSKTQTKAKEKRKPPLFNINSSSYDEDEDEDEEVSYDTTFTLIKPSKATSLEKNPIEKQTTIQISSDEEDESEIGGSVIEKDAEDLMEERQIEEHADLQSSPSHGKGIHKRNGEDLNGRIEKRQRTKSPESVIEEEEQNNQQTILDQDIEEDHQIEQDLHYVDDVFDQLPEQPEENEKTSEYKEIIEDDEEQIELPSVLEANQGEDDDLVQRNEEPNTEDEVRQQNIEIVDTSKESRSTTGSDRSSISPVASDQNTNETTADLVNVPRAEHLSNELEKDSNMQSITAEGHQHSGEEEKETAKEIDIVEFEMDDFINEDAERKEIEVVIIEDSDDELEEFVQSTSNREEVVQKTVDEKEEIIVQEGVQHEEREQSASDVEQEATLASVVPETVGEESIVPVAEEPTKEGSEIYLQSVTDAEVPAQVIEETSHNEKFIPPNSKDVNVYMNEEDDGDVQSATLPTENMTKHTEEESVDNFDAFQVHGESEASKENEISNVEAAPKAIQIAPLPLLSAQQEGTPANEIKYPQLSDWEEQEVSVEFEAMQIVSKGSGLSSGATDDDDVYDIEAIEVVKEVQSADDFINLDEEVFPSNNKGNLGKVEQVASIHPVNLESTVLQVDNDQASFAENEKIVDDLKILDKGLLTQKDPDQIVISSGKYPTPVSPAEDEEMDDDDNESVVSLSEAYYFSD